MIYRKLGRTGISVSEVGLGCEHLQGKDYETVKAVIDEAAKEGINILDVFMSEPQVRTDIGKAIKGRRESFIIQGHIGSIWLEGQYARSRDLEECRFFFEDLLSRLGTDYIDIGMLHFVDSEEDFDNVFNTGIIEYANELKQKGIIRALGLSSHNPVIAKRAVDTGQLDVLMFSINPVYDLLPEDTDINGLFEKEKMQTSAADRMNPARAALYEACLKNGCAITVMKTFCGGMLLNADISPFGTAIPPIKCMHYALTRPAVSSVLIGCTTPEQVRKAAVYETASDEEKDFSGILAGALKVAATGNCVYCNHCLPCTARIDIAQVNKYLDLALGAKSVPATVAEHYKAMEKHAGDCIACGSCEKNCPFGVHIIDRMEKAKQIFGM